MIIFAYITLFLVFVETKATRNLDSVPELVLNCYYLHYVVHVVLGLQMFCFLELIALVLASTCLAEHTPARQCTDYRCPRYYVESSSNVSTSP